MVKTLRLDYCLTDDEAAAFKDSYVDERHFDFDYFFSGEDVDVLKPDGSPLLMLRAGVLPADICDAAYPVLRTAARSSYQRANVAGGQREHRQKRDGTLSPMLTSVNPVDSGIVGHFEHTSYQPRCRLTAWVADNLRHWETVVEYARAVDCVFAATCPARYAAQMDYVKRTDPNWIIDDTVFTTMTVNKNLATSVHTDAGDLKDGFGVLSCFRRGDFEGCYLVFPKYRVAVDLRDRDVLLADVHEYHGNTAFYCREGEYERLSVVLYFREQMTSCGTPQEELERVNSVMND